MKKLVRPLISLGIVLFGSVASLVLAQVISSKNYKYNNVPVYYYANYQFADDWSAILDWFTKANAKYSVGINIPASDFAELYKHFKNTFPHLTKDYSVVYEKCLLLSEKMSRGYTDEELEAFMWNSCYKSLLQAINKINSSYTVNPSGTANPGWWMAPLTVTFDARGSSDPSQETIPEKNFYRYYRDEKWVDTPIGEKQVLNYTFNEAGKFIVHLVVRSSNVNAWILDWDQNLTINVTPKAADIVVYANTRRMVSTSPLKIWISEWEKWVVFDWSLTVPRWWRKILRHRWTITNSSASFSYDSKYIDGAPSHINVPLKWNWTFKVTLETQDNENNKVSETFDLFMSDPVTIIRQTPENWTTSTTFNFDGSASYSITSRLNTYVWELFDWNWDLDNWNKIMMSQGKEMKVNENKRLKPWNYLVRLTVTDMAWNQNVETKNLNVESTTPLPQFTVTPTSKRTNPSEFTLDASSTLDVDVDNGVDSLEYEWSFYPSNNDVEILSTENNNQRVVVRFNERWKHTVTLTATDEYWKSASTSKDIEVNSTLRPELTLIPWPITWGKTITGVSTVNRESSEIYSYERDFWDGTSTIESESATQTQHIYGQRWIYSVRLTVTDKYGDSNTVMDKAFIWEVDHPIAAYKIINGEWFEIQSSGSCVVKDKLWVSHAESGYVVDRNSKVTINPSISVNTKWTSNWLQYAFLKKSIMWDEQTTISNQFTTSFNETWCHYIDFTVNDSNVWKQDQARIRFNVRNAMPTIKNVTISTPQSSENYNTIWFSDTNNSDNSPFDCSWTSNVTLKVTAVDPYDSDWNISRLRFYYYNTDDPSRILEYKDTWAEVPYVYFIIPKIAWEYKFGVMVYDNDGWMVDSDDYLASNPSLYIPSLCENSDVPVVTLKVNRNNIQIWDEVTYTITSKVLTENDDFKTDRTFYYDFNWDGEWDLFTKKDTATYTFTEAYEDGITPRAGVEYRWKLWQTVGATIFVKNGIKPIFLYNSIWNKVIFRDLSVWIMQKREICFEKSECEAWNTTFKKTSISAVSPELLTGWTSTSITDKDYFVWEYDDYWTHNVSIYFKNKYWIEVEKNYEVKTSSNTTNWRIAPWINMITIPETTLTNSAPEIFLQKDMDNTVIMYINNESWEDCFVDVDIATDKDFNGKSEDDRNIECNKVVKVRYEPDYDSTIWRVYFKQNGELKYKDFYVTFEWVLVWLDDEKTEIYRDITKLLNWIESTLSVENKNLTILLDKLRKNLNNKPEVSSLVNTINEEINKWWIKMDSKQKDLLDSILARLSNEDTVVSVWLNEYEKNKKEILALRKSSKNEKLFKEFEEKYDDYDQQDKADALEKIWENVIKEGKNNGWSESDFNKFFCDIFDYYAVSQYSTLYNDKCWSTTSSITDNSDKPVTSSTQKSEKSGFPLRLKIILIVLVWWLLVMWWIIVFFSIKAKLNSSSENDEDEW